MPNPTLHPAFTTARVTALDSRRLEITSLSGDVFVADASGGHFMLSLPGVRELRVRERRASASAKHSSGGLCGGLVHPSALGAGGRCQGRVGVWFAKPSTE